MNFFLSFPIDPLVPKIKYSDKVFMLGSCFSTEIGDMLSKLKLNIFQNPTGIVYHPLIIAAILQRIIEGASFTKSELFVHENLYTSWLHHSSFSSSDAGEMLLEMNTQLEEARTFLSEASFVILTPATAYGYYLRTNCQLVANCHKMPSDLFEKKLSDAEEIGEGLLSVLEKLQRFNPRLKIIFTLSPVKHYRDGIVQNTISKSHVSIALHRVTTQMKNVFYFPAYEILVDELRDYRFYKADFAHPAETAVAYIFKRFRDFAFDDEEQKIMDSVQDVITAMQHRPKFPDSARHKLFVAGQLKKIEALTTRFPFLDFEKEIKYFEGI